MQPLAERLRPKTLDDYIGQKHLVGPGAILRKMIDAGRISSFILWGPPGVGKTTLAQIIANKLETDTYETSLYTGNNLNHPNVLVLLIIGLIRYERPVFSVHGYLYFVLIRG